jgi:hypothetical protein
MSNPFVLPLSASPWQSAADEFSRDPQPWRQMADRGEMHPRPQRISTRGCGYQAVIDGRRVALVNLSLTGAQVLGAVRVEPNQPTIVEIGWPHDKPECAAIARVRWVQAEPSERFNEEILRFGLAFEMWDVRRLKDILRHCERTLVPMSGIVSPWPTSSRPW